MAPKIYTLSSNSAAQPAPRWGGRAWALSYLIWGLAGLIALYICALAEPLHLILTDIESGAFEALNATMGRNAVWDWTIIVGASEFWILGSLAVLIAAALWEGWSQRHHDYGRVFGYLVLVFVAALVTLEAADFIADEVERRLPWRKEVVLAIIQQYDAEFLDYESKTGILDDVVAVWFAALFMIARRLPRTAIFGMALVGIHLFATITLGSQWLLSEAAAVCFGAAWGGAAILAGLGALNWLERKASTLFLTVFWRSLYHEALNNPGGRGSEQLVFRLNDIRQHLIPRIESFWQRLVKREALPLLGCAGMPFDLSKTPPGPPQPGFRPSRRVRFLTVNGTEHYVIRAIWRWGGALVPSVKFRRYAEQARCNHYLGRLGLPVARIYWVSERMAMAGLRSVGFCIEQFLSGRPMNMDNADERRQAAALLARMHGRTSPNWGAVAESATRTPSQYILHLLRPEVMYHMRKTARGRHVKFSQHDMERVWKLFEAEALAALGHDAPPFRLTHSDVHFRNILIDEKGGPWLVDFGEVRYDLAGWEIVKMAVALGNRQPDFSRHVWTEYFREAGDGRWREFGREARLGLARFALRELAQKRALAGWDKKDITRESILKWIEDLFVHRDDWWGARPEETNWRELIGFLGFKPTKVVDGSDLEAGREA